jgi:cephalosporin-C deacetylase-like acetyl esterase
VHAEEALWCTPRGQVVRDLQSTTVIDLNSARERELAAERAKFQAACTPDAFREAIRRKIALRMPIPVVHPTRYDTVEAQGHAITELCFETEPGIFVPALLYTPMGTPGPWPLSFYVHGEGNVAAGEAVTELVKKGTRVLAVEPRGIGETHPIGNGYAEHFGRDYNEASLSLNLARPLLGQRVYDLLVVLEYAANDPLTQRDEISVVGIGRTAPLALHAAALDTRIARVTIEHGLHSWASVVHATTHHDQFTNVVPGALELYDLPDLAQLIAPRTLCVRNENDPMGKPVLQPALEP